MMFERTPPICLRRHFKPWPGHCRARTPIACFRGSEMTTDGGSTRAMWRHWPWCFLFAPRCGQKSFARSEPVTLRSTRPFVDGVPLVARTRYVSQGIGVGFYDGTCNNVGHIATLSPCILYFDPQKRAPALELQRVMETAMTIPDEDMKYVDPETAPGSIQELLRLSGVDFVVELVSK